MFEGDTDHGTRPDGSASYYAKWVQSILSLDPDTWTQLHRDYSVELRSDIQKSLRLRDLPQEWVDDIEQETWLTAVRCMSTFVWIDEAHFYHFLRVISLKHVWTYRRRNHRYVTFDDHENGEDGQDDFLDTYLWDDNSVEDTVILRERMAALERVMRELNPLEREILMRRLMGESPRELASAYALKPEHLRMILWRAKQKIMTRFAPLEGETDD